MSKEQPCLEGTLVRVNGKKDYGFVNYPEPINEYKGEIPLCVFVHARNANGLKLRNGMHIGFDVRRSTHGQHEGKTEAVNVIELHPSG